MSFPPNEGPIAPERNPPVNPQYYQPSRFVITAITQGMTTTITTLTNANYVLGQLVRVLIPFQYGIQQLNNQTGIVVAIPAINQVTIDIDSRNYDAFKPTPIFAPTPPQIIALGDINSGVISNSGRENVPTNIPGSFINISPV